MLYNSKIYADKYCSVFQNGKAWKHLFYLCGIYITYCPALQRMEHLDADAVLSPAGFQCPEISWPKTDVALRPGCRVPEVYLSAGAES